VTAVCGSILGGLFWLVLHYCTVTSQLSFIGLLVLFAAVFEADINFAIESLFVSMVIDDMFVGVVLLLMEAFVVDGSIDKVLKFGGFDFFVAES
jgi:hypothetical protein